MSLADATLAAQDAPTATVRAARAASADSADELTVRLVDAAIDVFAENGFEKSGVAAIARRAGVTTGAIYSRWSGKQELMIHAIGRAVSDELDSILAGGTTSVTEILGSLGSLILEREERLDAVVAEAFVIARRDPEFRELLEAGMAEQRARFAAVLEEGKAKGEVDPTLSTEAVVALCHAISLGFTMFGAINQPLPAADEWNVVIERLLRAALPMDASASDSPTENHQ